MSQASAKFSEKAHNLPFFGQTSK